MNARTALLGQLIIFALTVGISAYYARILPETVPTHWNVQGQVDQYGSKWISLALLPGMVLFTVLLTLTLPILSPKNYELNRSGKAYCEIMLAVSGLMGALHVIILAGTANSHIDIGRWIFSGIFVFFAVVGNLMGKIKRNFYMGVRTPWTLADERVWTETHRVAAHQWFIGGIIGAVLVLVGVPTGIMIGFMLIVSLLPVVMSFVIYKRLNP